MSRARALLRYSLLVVAAAASTSCDILNPCYDEIENGGYENLYMDGIWGLSLVNGAPITGVGFKVNDTDYLRAGSMEFKTRKVEGACIHPEESSGVVLARYTLGTAGGQVKPGESASGDFNRANGSKVLMLKAYGLRLPGTLVNDHTLVFAGWNPDSWQNITLTFTR